jgi:beta-dihydromenaquinone-9 omega-hydroxylase
MSTDTQSPVTDAGMGGPAAVPPAADGGLGVFYDPLSYAAFDHPYEVYAQLREQAPVYYNPRRDLWVLSRYAEVKQCLGDTSTS